MCIRDSAKTAEHNWQLLAGLEQVVDLGYPVLLGTSRKGFLGKVGRTEGQERALDARAVVTAATSVRAARAGVWCVRVHDVVATVDAIDVAAALGEVRSLRDGRCATSSGNGESGQGERR